MAQHTGAGRDSRRGPGRKGKAEPTIILAAIGIYGVLAYAVGRAVDRRVFYDELLPRLAAACARGS